MKERYSGIDIFRVVFACLIPLLHINLPLTLPVYIIRQYISRFGVPFFFAVSGMFLSRTITECGNLMVMKKQLFRIGKMLILWVCIYAPLFSRGKYTINEYLFLTPGYLWYLSAIFFAIIPFCLFGKTKVKYAIAVSLYFIGTFFGGNYQWLSGGRTGWYSNVFVSTRNGLFFAFPLMCVGEMAWRTKKSLYKLILTGILMIAEITFVGFHVTADADRSMYFLLPIFTLYFVSYIKEWNPPIRKKNLAGYSSAIYLMQYGLIWVGEKIFDFAGLTNLYWRWGVYIGVIAIPVIFYHLIKNGRLARVLF